jgi:AcrR family transcriptional regulator
MSPKAKTKQEVVSEFRCGSILEAARKVFARKGFEQATVDDVAEATGVAKGTLYLYFRSKREIYLAALRRDVLAMNQDTANRVHASPTIEAKLRAFIGARVRYCEENRDFFKIYYSEFGNMFSPSPVPKEFREMYAQQARMLEGVLEKAAKAGQIRVARPESTALMIYDMTRGLIAQRMMGWSKAGVDEDVEFLFGLVWKGIAGNAQETNHVGRGRRDARRQSDGAGLLDRERAVGK